jgi:hypothetical protein
MNELEIVKNEAYEFFNEELHDEIVRVFAEMADASYQSDTTLEEDGLLAAMKQALVQVIKEIDSYEVFAE